MMKSLLNVSMEEFKAIAPRVAIYAVVAFAAVRTVEFAVNQTRRLIDGRSDNQ